MFYTSTSNGIPELFSGLVKRILMYIKFNEVIKKKRKETASGKFMPNTIQYRFFNLLWHLTHKPKKN
jgi:hypothetical protein